MIGSRPKNGNLRRIRRLTRHALAGATALLIGGCAQVYYATIGSADSAHNLDVHRSIMFDAANRISLDVYAPHAAAIATAGGTADVARAPVVVFFYGGSWEGGRRRWYRYVGETLASNGIIAVIPDYRKFPDVRFPEFMDDAAIATKWAKDHIGEYGGDPTRVFVMGHSAGGHIAALLACDKRYLAKVGLAPGDLAGMIGLAGAYAFLPYEDDEAEIFGDDPKGRYDSQPINFVDGDEPPMLLLQGLDDDEVKPNNAEVMAERAQAMDGTAVMKLYPGVDHGSLLLALARARSGAHEAPVLRDIVDFVAHPPQRKPVVNDAAVPPNT